MKRSFQHVALHSNVPNTLETYFTRPWQRRALSHPTSYHRTSLLATGGDLETILQEEALLHLVLLFLNVREHQVIRQTSRLWRQRVQTLALERLDLSWTTVPISSRIFERTCQNVLQCYSRVRRLDLSSQRSLRDRDLLVLSSTFWAQLEELIVDDCLELSDFGLLAVLNAQSLRLRTVSVRRCKRIRGHLFATRPLQLTGSHPSLTNLHFDDTSVTSCFISRLEAHFPTLQQLSALHTPAHRAFFERNSTLSPILRELQWLLTHELVQLPLLPALLDEYNQWSYSRRGQDVQVYERTLIASGSRALLEIPLLLPETMDSEPSEDAGALISPLLYACATGKTRLIPVLLALHKTQSLDLENTDADGHSALSLAVANGLIEATRLLLRAGSNVNTRALSLACPLYLASEQGCDDLVDMLLHANAQRDSSGPNNTSALSVAAKNGHRSTVLRLLAAEQQALDEQKAPSRLYTQQLVQALFLACEGGHLAIVSDLLLLTDLNANVLMGENVSPLYLTCQMGYVAIASLLLERNADPNFRRPNGGVSCLYIAAQEGHKEIVALLLKAGANINAKMDDMSTALHIAARMGRKSVTHVLLHSGAQLNDQTRSGLSALYIASEEGHLKLVQYLLNVGAARDLQTSTGATALFAAVQRRHHVVVKALLIGGASVAIAKHNGTTPLDAAALMGDVKTTQLLLRFGARVGGLALHLAERRRDATDLQSLLRTRYYMQHAFYLDEAKNTLESTRFPRDDKLPVGGSMYNKI